MMTDLCERLPLAASARKIWLIDSPPSASPPIFKNPRRETASQNSPPSARSKIVNMRQASPGKTDERHGWESSTGET